MGSPEVTIAQTGNMDALLTDDRGTIDPSGFEGYANAVAGALEQKDLCGVFETFDRFRTSSISGTMRRNGYRFFARTFNETKSFSPPDVQHSMDYIATQLTALVGLLDQFNNDVNRPEITAIFDDKNLIGAIDEINLYSEGKCGRIPDDN